MAPTNKNPKKTPVEYKPFNYDKATELAKSQALDKNTAALTQGAVNIAQRLAGNVQSLGQAAALGGQFVDTSAAPGYQSPVTGQYTGMLMRSVTNPILAAQQGTLAEIRLRNKKKYEQALMSKDAKGATAARAGITTPTTTSGYSPTIL
jgi:hypothetical protein